MSAPLQNQPKADREPVYVTPSVDQVDQFVANSNRLLRRAIRLAYKDASE